MFKDLGTFFRMLRTGWVLIRHDALVPKEYEPLVPGPVRFVGGVSRIFSRRGRDENPGARFAQALEKLGPAYIKFGQILSTRGDMFDPVFAKGLSRLKDKVPPFAMDVAEAKLAQEWGVPWQERLISLSEPMAAASVAQVHKGVLKDKEGKAGAIVAVKILRPNIQARMARDLKVIALVARLAHKFVPNIRRLHPIAFVKEAKRALSLELDLRLEAAAASEMAEIAVETGLFTVPDLHWDLVDKNILVTDWVDGIAMSDDEILDLPLTERQALATKVIQSFLASTFEFGVFHADMHEGNMIYSPDGELVLIDFGILGRLGKKEIRFEIDTLYGFLQRDYYKIAQVHFDIGYVPPHHNIEDFASALRAVGEPIFGKNAEDVSMAKVLLQLLEITELFDMELQPQLLLLQKTMMQTEGVARRLDPEFDMWEASREIVERAAREELGPQRYIGDFMHDLGRLQKSMSQLPDAMDNITELSRAWVNGEIDLSSAPKAAANDVKSRPVIKGLAYAAGGAILAVGGMFAAGYL